MKYFSIEEMCASQDAAKRNIANNPTGQIADRIAETIEKALDPIRAEWGSGIKVNSGYRCTKLNTAIGGSSTSAHTTGYAADIVPSNGNMAALQRLILKWAETNAFDQIIIEYPKGNIASWIHIGWKNNQGQQRRQILYTTNGKNYLPVSKGSAFYNVK